MPGLGHRDREVDRDSRLALAGKGAGDDDDLLVVVDLNVLHVGAKHAERLGPRRGLAKHLVRWQVGGLVVGDVGQDRGARHLTDVLARCHRGIEQLAGHGQSDAEQQPEDSRQPQVAERQRGHRNGRLLRVVDDRGPDERVLLAAGRLEVLDELGEALTVGLRDVASDNRIRVMAVIWSRTVWGTTVAATWVRSSSALAPSPRLSATRSASWRLVTRSAYDATRWVANRLPV